MRRGPHWHQGGPRRRGAPTSPSSARPSTLSGCRGRSPRASTRGRSSPSPSRSGTSSCRPPDRAPASAWSAHEARRGPAALLPGHPALDHRDLRRGGDPQRHVPEPGLLRRRGARRALLPVLQQDEAERPREPDGGARAAQSGDARGLPARGPLRARGDERTALRSHGPAHRGDRVPHGHPGGTSSCC